MFGSGIYVKLPINLDDFRNKKVHCDIIDGRCGNGFIQWINVCYSIALRLFNWFSIWYVMYIYGILYVNCMYTFYYKTSWTSMNMMIDHWAANSK